jgi:hypothetical protein
MEETTTNRLENVLLNAHSISSLEDYLYKDDATLPYGSFVDYFFSLPEVSGKDKSEIIRKSGIERTYCYQIFNKRKKPGRDKIIELSIAMGLSLKETQRGLKIGNEPVLYSRNKRDAIIIFCINEGKNLMDTEELLTEYGENSLEDWG